MTDAALFLEVVALVFSGAYSFHKLFWG